jgi:hypothetical protein
MDLTINLEVVVAAITIIGAVAAVVVSCGRVITKFALMQAALAGINNELLEIKILVKSYEETNDMLKEELNDIRIEMAEIKASSKSAHHRLDGISNVNREDVK